jgi:transcriptional regulator with XRE-family HTH domain
MEKTIYSREYEAVLRLLRDARAKAGVTQAELAGTLGLTQSQVSKIERGETRLDVIQLRAVCRALRVTLVEFAKRLEREIRRPG